MHAGVQVGRQPALLLASTTDTFTNRQPTEKKRKRMTPQNVDAYNRAMMEEGVVGGKGPFGLLDLFALTRGELLFRSCCIPILGGPLARHGLLR